MEKEFIPYQEALALKELSEKVTGSNTVLTTK